MNQDCEECARLWRDYAVATHEHVKLEGKLQIAALSHDESQIRQLQPLLEAASERRTTLREQIKRHEAEGHPKGGPSAK